MSHVQRFATLRLAQPRLAVAALQRLVAALGLALALLVVQQATLQHSVSHYAEQSEQQQHKGHPVAEQCAKCLALASLSGAPPASHYLPLPTPGSEAIAYFQYIAHRPVDRLPFSARAPPLSA